MRTLATLRYFALAAFFLLLVGGVILKPGQRADSASTAPAAASDGGVYSAG